MPYKELTLLSGQTLYDVAIQEYGHTDGVFLLLEDNEGVIDDLSEIPPAGTKLLIRLQVPELSDDNRAIAAEFARRGQQVVSGLPANRQPKEYVLAGYWNKGYSQIR
jgi:hypothetical protein